MSLSKMSKFLNQKYWGQELPPRHGKCCHSNYAF